MKCYWSASWRFVWMHPGVSAGLTVTVSSLHHFSHETVTAITAVNVMERRERETCLRNMVSVWIRNQWPVIMETSLKLMLKPRLYKRKSATFVCRDGRQNYCWLSRKDSVGWIYELRSCGNNLFHSTSHTDWQPSSVACKLMESMATDRLGHFLGSHFFFVDYRSEFGRGHSLMDNVMAIRFLWNLQFNLSRDSLQTSNSLLR